MTKLWRRAVIPLSLKYRERLQDSIRSCFRFTDTLTPPEHLIADPSTPETDEPELIADLKRKSKIIFTLDGCWEQMNAVMKNLNKDFLKNDCEAFKFAAASTMVQQPNDVGRMHCNMHAYYKSNKYLTEDYFRIPKVMVPMKEILLHSGLDPASFRTYWKALASLPDCLVKSCAPEVVVDGFKKSGIWPIDNNAIMSGWSGWSKLQSTVAAAVLQEIPKLAALAQK